MHVDEESSEESDEEVNACSSVLLLDAKPSARRRSSTLQVHWSYLKPEGGWRSILCSGWIYDTNRFISRCLPRFIHVAFLAELNSASANSD
jgi:hypothetical protein